MAHERGLSASWCVVAALTLPLGALAQKSPVGGEFQVNTHTLNGQALPSVAADADGDFVIVWDSAGGQDGYQYGVFGRRFSSVGVPLGTEFQVNAYTSRGQRVPSVGLDADGDFVVTWRSGAGADYEIFARRFSSVGAALDSDFMVNTYTTDQQINPAVAVGASGDFVVAWVSFSQDGSNGVFAQRFTSAGAVVATEFQVNTFTADYQRSPAVVAGDSGDFVVAWQSNLQDGSSWGVFARRFSSAGALASEFQVSSYTTGYQGPPALAMDSDGDFVIVWESRYQDGYEHGIFAQRFSSGGAPLATEFQVSTYTTGNDKVPSVAASASGDFVVAWRNFAQLNDVFARRFSSAGVPLTTTFLVNTYTLDTQHVPAVAAEGDGDFIVAWQSAQDGSDNGIFAQRFAAIATLDVDGDGDAEPLSDGLLVLRFQFGFTGTTLTGGAVDTGACTRCDAAAIQPYLAGLGAVLDVDGNLVVDALFDGVLALRFLFGFTGTTLTSGAVDTGGGCTRCDAGDIEPYLAGLRD